MRVISGADAHERALSSVLRILCSLCLCENNTRESIYTQVHAAAAAAVRPSSSSRCLIQWREERKFKCVMGCVVWTVVAVARVTKFTVVKSSGAYRVIQIQVLKVRVYHIITHSHI